MVINIERAWEDLSLKASLQPLRESFLFFLTDQAEFGIGTIIAGVPGLKDTLSNSPSSTALIGTKDLNLSRIIIKNLCKRLEKPVIGFIDIKSTIPELKLGKFVIELLEILLKEHEKKKV